MILNADLIRIILDHLGVDEVKLSTLGVDRHFRELTLDFLIENMTGWTVSPFQIDEKVAFALRQRAESRTQKFHGLNVIYSEDAFDIFGDFSWV